MLIEGTLMFTLFLALVGLGIDGTRWMLLRSNVAYVATSAAAAGARQLDQKEGAIARATSAANQVASTNATALGDGLTSISAAAPKFYSSLSPKALSADDSTAQFIEIDANGSATPLFVVPIPLAASTAAYQ